MAFVCNEEVNPYVVNVSLKHFFFKIFRYQLFEKAFRLGIDLHEHDLFLDLYYYAKSINNMEMANAAWEKSQEIADECSTSGACELMLKECLFYLKKGKPSNLWSDEIILISVELGNLRF